MNWTSHYFLAATKKPLSELELSEQQITSLLKMLQIPSHISTGLCIDPLQILNQKGLTVWQFMYIFLKLNHPDHLDAVAKGGALYLPKEFFAGVFGNHNNWPQAMISQYSMKHPDYNFFIIPFLRLTQTKSPAPMTQSLKAPDGSMEIFGLHDFSETAPQKVLERCADLKKHLETYS